MEVVSARGCLLILDSGPRLHEGRHFAGLTGRNGGGISWGEGSRGWGIWAMGRWQFGGVRTKLQPIGVGLMMHVKDLGRFFRCFGKVFGTRNSLAGRSIRMVGRPCGR